MKISLEGMKGRCEQAEEGISNLKIRMEIIKSEEWKKQDQRKVNITEETHRTFIRWVSHYIHCGSLRRRRERERGRETI